MSFTSGTQKLQGRKVNHDPEPYRNKLDGTRSAHDPEAHNWDWLWSPRAEFSVEDNPILAAFREYPDHSVESVQNWLDVMLDPSNGTDEVAALIMDAVGGPAGPGWEDPYWDWLSRVHPHTISVFKRLINLNR